MQNKRKSSTVTIGVIGTQRGCGNTHFCLMLAVFLAVIQGKRVALFEQNNTDCFRQAETMYSEINHKSHKILRKISIYKQSDNDALSEIISSDYEYVVIDYGSDYTAVRSSFLMCNVKIAVGNLSTWKIHSYMQFLAATKNEGSRHVWAMLGNFPSHNGIEYLKHEFKVRVKSIPYEPDPLYLGTESMDFLQQITEKYL